MGKKSIKFSIPHLRNRQSDLGKYLEAIADYNEKIKLNKDDPNGYVLRGNAFLALGKYSQAKQDLEEASNLYLRQGKVHLAKQMLDIIEVIN